MVNRKVFIIELMNLEELKSNLKAYLPDMVVRYCNSKSNITSQYGIFSDRKLFIISLLANEKELYPLSIGLYKKFLIKLF